LIIIIKPRRMRWAEHIARMIEKRNAYRLLVGKPGERDHWEDQDIGGWITLRWILERLGWVLDWIDCHQTDIPGASK
jgi:hypothetical protein